MNEPRDPVDHQDRTHEPIASGREVEPSALDWHALSRLSLAQEVARRARLALRPRSLELP